MSQAGFTDEWPEIIQFNLPEQHYFSLGPFSNKAAIVDSCGHVQ